MSIYEKIGGEPAVSAAVDLLYKKMLADPFLMPFFDGVSMSTLHRKQAWFLTTLLKGESVGADSYMRMSHRRLVDRKGLSDEHFDAVTVHLEDSLRELDVPESFIADIMSAAASLKDAVLDR